MTKDEDINGGRSLSNHFCSPGSPTPSVYTRTTIPVYWEQCFISPAMHQNLKHRLLIVYLRVFDSASWMWA